MKKNLIHGTMALLFVLVVCISSAAAVDDTVTRDLPDSADAGAPITIDLTVDVETGATYYLIDEIVPSGWTVTSATDGGDYTTTTGHVTWAVLSGAADTVYSYTVEVPTDASGAYTFGGTYMFEDMADEATILGDTTVMVGDVDTVTRDLPDNASAGAPITVDLTVDVETGATYYLIDEIVPSGWTVTSATDGGDYTTTTGHVTWAVLSGAADTVYSYTVEVPTDASGAYTFGGTYMFEDMADEATILGDTTVTVGAAVTPALTTFTVTPASVAQGGTVEIDIAFSTGVSWVINVNSSTATVETWSGTSTNPTVKDWVTSTSTATGAYTVDVFMNGVLADSKTVTVTEAGAAALASITSWTLPATGTRGTAIDATVTIENTGTETLWFVVSVAGASTTGESIVGLGTIELAAGATKDVHVKIPVPGDADAAGTYTLIPDVYTFEGYPDVGTLQATGSGDTIVIS